MRRKRRWAAVVLILGLGLHAVHSAQPAPVTWLIFADDLHLDFRNTGRIRDLVRTIVKELGNEGDRFAIATSGPSKVNLAATADRQEIASAIRFITGNALKFEDMQSPASAQEIRYRFTTAIAAARAMLANASSLPGSVTMMVFVSNGYGVIPADVADQMTALIDTAKASGVPIFGILPPVTLDLLNVVPHDAWQAHLDASKASLRSLSEATGGFAIVDRDLVPQLRRIVSIARQ